MIYNFRDKVKQSLYAQGYEQKDIKYVRVKILSTIAKDYQDFDISYDTSGLEGALSQYVVECNICPSQSYGGGDGIHIEWHVLQIKLNIIHMIKQKIFIQITKQGMPY